MIRAATEEDAGRLLEIYGYYIENTAITYEYTVPTEEAFRLRIQNTLKAFPYLVMEEAGQILGYAYAGRFHPRKSFDWAAEGSVYLAEDARGKGIGPKLYEALEECLKLQGFVKLYASIAYPPREDQYLTKNSVQFHSHMGYKQVAHFSGCAYKFGNWYDLVWMEKQLQELPEQPQPVKTFDQIRTCMHL